MDIKQVQLALLERWIYPKDIRRKPQLNLGTKCELAIYVGR